LGRRRKSRELAIQILYQLELNKSDTEYGLQIFWENFHYPDGIKEFTNHLVKGTAEHKEQIDEIITKTAKNWSFSRITPVDRSILREAIFEIFFCPEIPYKVTLNEAIELGKKFGSEKSGAFINGVLDNVIEQNVDINKQNILTH
jgi:N utilization substance protein B